MNKPIAILAVASLVALGGCKSRQAENISNAPAEANVSENYPAEMNAATPTENNAAAEMNATAGANESAANNAAAPTSNM